MLCQALCIISKPSQNSNWSYSPETLDSGQNRQFFCPVWTWNLMDDLEKQTGTFLFYVTSGFVHHFIAIGQFILDRVTVWKRPIWVKISKISHRDHLVSRSVWILEHRGLIIIISIDDHLSFYSLLAFPISSTLMALNLDLAMFGIMFSDFSITIARHTAHPATTMATVAAVEAFAMTRVANLRIKSISTN